MDDAENTARQQPMMGRRIMDIKSIVAGAAIALAAATSLASASEKLSPRGGVPGESPTFVPNTGSGYFGLSNENDAVSKTLMRQQLMREYSAPSDDPSEDWILTFPAKRFYSEPGGGLGEDNREPVGGGTPTTPDPSAARYRVKFTMFPFPKISIDGSTVDKSLGKRTIRIKLPSGKFVTEEITIMQTEDGKIYGVGAGLHNFGPMHESRNQPFPGQIQYSFDEDPIPRPATPGAGQSVEAGDQDTVPSGDYNLTPPEEDAATTVNFGGNPNLQPETTDTYSEIILDPMDYTYEEAQDDALELLDYLYRDYLPGGKFHVE